MVTTCIVTLALTGAGEAGQSPAPPPSAPPQFEAASIRRGAAGDAGVFMQSKGDTFTARNAPVQVIVLQAYGFKYHPSEIIGLPTWATTEPYEVVAKAGRPNAPIYAMLRTLLGDRFQLKAHEEQREQPVYNIVLNRTDGRLGSGLIPNSIDCLAAAQSKEPTAERCFSRNTGQDFEAKGATLQELASELSSSVGRRVFDKTGLSGRFNIDLHWDPQGFASGPLPTGVERRTDGPSIFAAIQDQLGLKLETASTAIPVLVIDSIERPSEN